MARLITPNDWLYVVGTPVTAAPFTMAGWIYPIAVTDKMTLLSIGKANVADEFWVLYVRANFPGDLIRFQAKSYYAREAITSTGVTVNTWHHICGVEAASNDRAAYIDGGSKGTNAGSCTPTGVTRTTIGVTADSTQAFWMNGRVFWPAIWNVALTDDEVALLAAGVSPLLVRPSALAAFWPLEPQDSGGLGDMIGGYDLTASGTSPAGNPDRALIRPTYPRLMHPSAAAAGQTMTPAATAVPVVVPEPNLGRAHPYRARPAVAGTLIHTDFEVPGWGEFASGPS